MIKAVIFDMDGTLFDTERVYSQAWYAAGEALGIAKERIDHALAHCRGVNAKSTRLYFETHLADAVTYDDFIETRRPFFDAILERMGGVPKKPGLDELFSYLKANGIRIGLATSTRRARTVEMLTKAGLLDRFDAIMAGDMVENGKPDPEIYLRAAQEMGIDPAECMGVEDSLAGVEAIHRAGMFTVMIPDMVAPTPAVEAMLDVKCNSLHEIIPLLQRLNKNGVN
ncbi:MAG: HAD family phosphatase [Clostridia bacterium]|nr:HAD family phosphatase [Clostridia bacterium]